MSDDTQVTQSESLHQKQAVEPVEWTVGRLLLDAHLRTGEAFEQYLLFQTMRDDEESFTAHDTSTYETALEEAILKHERIIENLEQAHAAVSTETTPADDTVTND